VRSYIERDLDQLIQVYKSAFAEPPWNEYMKCVSCSVEYGRQELNTRQEDCKKCNQPLNLVEFWSDAEIVEDLGFALAQPDPIVLVAENSDGLAGMTWGYRIPFEKFPFLQGKVPAESSYMDEIAVRGDKRLKGVGTLLGRAYIEAVRQQGLSEIVLRTDERNASSMSLFGKLGLSGIADSESSRGKVYDPQFPNRIYLRREV
jgi:GNAT superfamily N-acetyltransferase